MNVHKIYIISIFIILFTDIISSQNVAVIPFKAYYNSFLKTNTELTSLDYYKLYHSSNIYLEMEVGNENKLQTLSLFIKLDDYLFYIKDNDNNSNYNNICGYSTDLSPTFKVVNSENIILGKPSFYASDYFKIYTDFDKVNNRMINIEFLYYKNDKDNIASKACGSVGFLFPKEQKGDLWKRNFINQISKDIKNIDYSFTFKYENEKMDEGLFIIGIESYEKNISKNDNLINIYNKADKFGFKDKYQFLLVNIYIGYNNYFQNENIEISINIKSDIEGFEFPKFMFNKLNEIYFNKYYNNNICEFEIIDRFKDYILIYCFEDKFGINDIKNFPEINLLKYKLGFNFSFSGEELFYKKGKKYFFKILFYSKEYRNEFNLGRLFLKKYQLIFNPISNYMAFYINNKINVKKVEQKNIFYLSLSKYIFISIIFVIIGFFLGRKFCISRRNKYAKELEDNDNYISKYESINNKKESKLIDF